MRVFSIRKQNIFVILFLTIVTVLLNAFYAFAAADVTATHESTVKSSNTITVAGNPNYFPYEYYDKDKEMYEGLFPQLYALIGMETGCNFVYVDAGESDNRLIDSKNGNAEIVSAYLYVETQADNYRLKDEIPVIEYELNGDMVQICIIFSHTTSEKIIQDITNAFHSIPESQIKNLLAQCSAENSKPQHNILFDAIIIVLALILAAAAGRILILEYKKIQERKHALESEYLDPLTGLGNKKYFDREIDRMNSESHPGKYAMAYIAFDIARVNKQYGEEIAEHQLCCAADMLRTEKNAIIARVAGGAIGILRIFTTEDEFKNWAETQISRLNESLDDFGKNYTPKFSCGIYRLPEQNRDKTDIFKKAYRCYEIAVKEDSDCFFYSSDMEMKDIQDDKLTHEFARAIKESEIVQYLQPVVNAETGAIIGAESLARWKHPELGLLTPQRFVPLLIEERRILDLDMLLFEESCKCLSKWRESGKSYCIFTNFTRTSLASADFIHNIQQIAGKYFFSRKNLIVEITEDSLADNEFDASQNIIMLKDLGFSIALDNFGSGFNYFADLKHYPLDYVNINSSMLINSENPRAEILMSGSIQMCKNMGIKIIGEGIENEEQYNAVKRIGCDYIQGFYFYQVLDPAEAEKVM